MSVIFGPDPSAAIVDDIVNLIDVAAGMKTEVEGQVIEVVSFQFAIATISVLLTFLVLNHLALLTPQLSMTTNNQRNCSLHSRY